jgi:hypothetical protein
MQFVPKLGEVHAWLTRDESFLATSDKGAFVKHQTAPKFENLYRSSALPVHAWSADGTGRYDFQPLGKAVIQLWCAWHQLLANIHIKSIELLGVFFFTLL